MNKDFFKRLLTGPIFLALFLIMTPVTWLSTQIFGYILKFNNWVVKNFRKSLNMEE